MCYMFPAAFFLLSWCLSFKESFRSKDPIVLLSLVPTIQKNQLTAVVPQRLFIAEVIEVRALLLSARVLPSEGGQIAEEIPQVLFVVKGIGFLFVVLSQGSTVHRGHQLLNVRRCRLLSRGVPIVLLSEVPTVQKGSDNR